MYVTCTSMYAHVQIAPVGDAMLTEHTCKDVLVSVLGNVVRQLASNDVDVG